LKKSLTALIYTVLILSLAAGCANPKNEIVVEETLQTSSEEVEEKLLPTSTPEQKEEIFTNTLNEKIPLIFSHDGAPDDIATLVYIAKHPYIELIGVIQSYGEQHPTQSVDEWQVFLYDVLDYDDAAIAVGSEIPVDPNPNEFPEGWRSGADNFWGLDLPTKADDYDAAVGYELIIDLVKNSPEKVTVLVTGAQTDMALALQEDASIADNISQIVIMGGAFNVGGNLYESAGNENNEVAEWNIYVDPLAAKIVFNSGVPLSIVPLDGSDDFMINAIHHAKIRDSVDPALEVLSQLWEQQLNWWGGEGFKIWDIVAAAAVTNPEHFTWTYDGVDVIAEVGELHGQTIILNNGSQITRFASDTDYKMVRNSIFEVYQ
jgi:inosine-uridine nucleoside N-ribohydrolase